jgi:hypothetical protein
METFTALDKEEHDAERIGGLKLAAGKIKAFQATMLPL